MKVKRLYLAVVLAILFGLVASVAVPGLPGSVTPAFAAGTTWYVSNSGSNGTGDGSQGNPWQTIQYAIDNASVLSGDTINVAAGTYFNEQLVINKSLTIEGAGDSTVIQPSGPSILTDIYTYSSSYPYWPGAKLPPLWKS